MRRKVKVQAESTVLTYSYLRGVSWNALEYVKQSNEGSFYNCMTAMVFSAFCVEAYLNHLGQEKIEFWQEIERGLGPREKLNVLSQVIGHDPDFAARPFQTFTEMFRFRDMIVHGKSETLRAEVIETLAQDERPSLPETKWQKICTEAQAKRFFEDTEAIIMALHKIAGFDEHPFLTHGIGGWKLEQLDDITKQS